MVLLTMTPAIVLAMQQADISVDKAESSEELESTSEVTEPSLEAPEIGKPISHSQILTLSQALKAKGQPSYHLDTLLRGSKIYVPPPPPKPEKTPEYKALMARLHAEEEARTYERMLNPPPPTGTFSQHFPSTSAAFAFSSTAAYQHAPSSDFSHLSPFSKNNQSQTDDDETTFADIDRQMALIFNVLISIVCCAAALWIAARWWSTPARLALSLSGSALVAVAEVAVYWGYIHRVKTAKEKERGKKEVREVIGTWSVGGGSKLDDAVKSEGVAIKTKKDDTSGGIRKRKTEVGPKT